MTRGTLIGEPTTERGGLIERRSRYYGTYRENSQANRGESYMDSYQAERPGLWKRPKHVLRGGKWHGMKPAISQQRYYKQKGNHNEARAIRTKDKDLPPEAKGETSSPCAERAGLRSRAH